MTMGSGVNSVVGCTRGALASYGSIVRSSWIGDVRTASVRVRALYTHCAPSARYSWATGTKVRSSASIEVLCMRMCAASDPRRTVITPSLNSMRAAIRVI